MRPQDGRPRCNRSERDFYLGFCWQVCTGDGWAQYIARPLIGNVAGHSTAASAAFVNGTDGESGGGVGGHGGDGGPPLINRWVGVYFISFFFITCICLLGVVHAILLDEFMLAMQVPIPSPRTIPVRAEPASQRFRSCICSSANKIHARKNLKRLLAPLVSDSARCGRVSAARPGPSPALNALVVTPLSPAHARAHGHWHVSRRSGRVCGTRSWSGVSSRPRSSSPRWTPSLRRWRTFTPPRTSPRRSASSSSSWTPTAAARSTTRYRIRGTT